MPLYLLLEQAGGTGHAVKLRPAQTEDGNPEHSYGLPEAQFSIDLAPDDDALYRSALAGGGLAYQVLWREGYVRQAMTACFELEQPPAHIHGHSGDLLFALAVAAAAMQMDCQSPAQDAPALAATGVLDENGLVTPVLAVTAKLQAALAQMPNGGLFFCPDGNYADIDTPLRQQAERQGVAIHPVERLEDALERLGIATENTWLDAPYRGLLDFHYGHRRIFFGRQRDTGQLRRRLLDHEKDGQAGIVILGGSGAGKSSLVQAGLFPALAQGPDALLDRPVTWTLWRPRLATERGEAALAGSIHAAWARQLPGLPTGDTLASLADALAAAWPRRRRFVWLADQLEELFTLGFAAAAIAAFVDFLRRLQSIGVWTVATLRNDFYPDYQRHLAATLPAYNLGALDAAATDQIIQGPAQLAGLSFETDPHSGLALAVQLREDMAGRADALPLLEFALGMLHENRDKDGERMTWAAYRRIGGLQGAIGSHADGVFQALDAAAQASLPGLLWQLSIPARETGKIASQALRLDTLPADGPVRHLVDAFVAERLLVLDRDAGDTVWLRVAHEALLEHWQHAKALIDGFAEDKPLHGRLQEQASLWRAAGGDPSWLLPAGLPLQEAADLLERRRKMLEADVAALVEASERAERARIDAEAARQQAELQAQRRRTRIAWAVAVALGVLATGAGVGGYLAWQGQREAEENFAQTRQTVNTFVADIARQELADIPGLQEYREKYARKAVEQYAELAGRRPDDAAIREGYAKACATFASMLSQIGSMEEAFGQYEKAIRLRALNAKSEPGNWRYQLDLQVSRNDLGKLYWELKKPDLALPLFNQIIADLTSLLSVQEGNEKIVGALADAYNMRGNLAKSTQTEAEIQDYQRSAELALRRVKILGEKANFSALESLFLAKYNLSEVYKRTGDYDQALSLKDEADAHMLSALKLNPKSIDLRLNYFESLFSRGRLLALMNRHGEAWKTMEDALDKMQRTYDENPKVTRYGWALAKNLIGYSKSQHGANHDEQAFAATQKAIAILEDITRRADDRPYYGTALLEALEAASRYSMAQQRPIMEQKRWAELTATAESGPPTPENQLQPDPAKIAEIHQNAQHYLETARRLAAKYPKELPIQSKLVKSLQQSASWAELEGNVAIALAYRQEAMQTYSHNIYTDDIPNDSRDVADLLDHANGIMRNLLSLTNKQAENLQILAGMKPGNLRTEEQVQASYELVERSKIIEQARFTAESAYRIGKSHTSPDGLASLCQTLSTYSNLLPHLASDEEKFKAETLLAVAWRWKTIAVIEPAWQKARWHKFLHRCLADAYLDFRFDHVILKNEVASEVRAWQGWLQVWGIPIVGMDANAWLGLIPELATQDDAWHMRGLDHQYGSPGYRPRLVNIPVAYPGFPEPQATGVYLANTVWPEDPLAYETVWLKRLGGKIPDAIRAEITRLSRMAYVYKIPFFAFYDYYSADRERTMLDSKGDAEGAAKMSASILNMLNGLRHRHPGNAWIAYTLSKELFTAASRWSSQNKWAEVEQYLKQAASTLQAVDAAGQAANEQELAAMVGNGIAIEPEKAAEKIMGEAQHRRKLLGQIAGNLSFAALFNAHYQEAISAAQQMLDIDPDSLWVKTNIAHGLLFLGRFEEAERVYLEAPDAVLGNGKTFRQTVFEDYKIFRENGLDHPGMAKIEAMLRP